MEVAASPEEDKEMKQGRPYVGDADFEHKVRVSKDLDRAIRLSAKKQRVGLSKWWRRAARLAVRPANMFTLVEARDE